MKKKSYIYPEMEVMTLNPASWVCQAESVWGPVDAGPIDDDETPPSLIGR